MAGAVGVPDGEDLGLRGEIRPELGTAAQQVEQPRDGGAAVEHGGRAGPGGVEDRGRPVGVTDAPELSRHGVERLVPRDARPLTGAAGPDPAERMGEPVGVVDALRLAEAADARVEGRQLGGPPPRIRRDPDDPVADDVSVDDAAPAAVVAAGAGDDRFVRPACRTRRLVGRRSRHERSLSPGRQPIMPVAPQSTTARSAGHAHGSLRLRAHTCRFTEANIREPFGDLSRQWRSTLCGRQRVGLIRLAQGHGRLESLSSGTPTLRVPPAFTPPRVCTIVWMLPSPSRKEELACGASPRSWLSAASSDRPCPSHAQGGKDALSVDLPGEPASLDPHVQWDTDSYHVYRNIFDNLVTRNPDGQIVPQIAKAWRYESDTALVLDIRTDVKFHDGTPLTVDDVVWSVQRIIDPAFKSPQLSPVQQHRQGRRPSGPTRCG